MIDIGVNLTNNRFDKDRGDVIARALDKGVVSMLVTGTNVDESRKAQLLCLDNPSVLYSTAGVHPHDADNASDDFIEQLRVLAASPSVKAIGECGLDFNRNFSTPDNQRRVFAAQVELAADLNMPLFLHQRDAFTSWFNLLEPFIGKVPAMVAHCFTGSKSELATCVEAGMYIGITGWLCDERRGQALRDIVADIPLNKLLIETDAPYLTPRTIRPKPKSSRNEPSYLPWVVKALAELTGHTEADICRHSSENAQRAFSLEAGNE